MSRVCIGSQLHRHDLAPMQVTFVSSAPRGPPDPAWPKVPTLDHIISIDSLMAQSPQVHKDSLNLAELPKGLWATSQSLARTQTSCEMLRVWTTLNWSFTAHHLTSVFAKLPSSVDLARWTKVTPSSKTLGHGCKCLMKQHRNKNHSNSASGLRNTSVQGRDASLSISYNEVTVLSIIAFSL